MSSTTHADQLFFCFSNDIRFRAVHRRIRASIKAVTGRENKLVRMEAYSAPSLTWGWVLCVTLYSSPLLTQSWGYVLHCIIADPKLGVMCYIVFFPFADPELDVMCYIVL